MRLITDEKEINAIFGSRGVEKPSNVENKAYDEYGDFFRNGGSFNPSRNEPNQEVLDFLRAKKEGKLQEQEQGEPYRYTRTIDKLRNAAGNILPDIQINPESIDWNIDPNNPLRVNHEYFNDNLFIGKNTRAGLALQGTQKTAQANMADYGATIAKSLNDPIGAIDPISAIARRVAAEVKGGDKDEYQYKYNDPVLDPISAIARRVIENSETAKPRGEAWFGVDKDEVLYNKPPEERIELYKRISKRANELRDEARQANEASGAPFPAAKEFIERAVLDPANAIPIASGYKGLKLGARITKGLKEGAGQGLVFQQAQDYGNVEMSDEEKLLNSILAVSAGGIIGGGIGALSKGVTPNNPINLTPNTPNTAAQAMPAQATQPMPQTAAVQTAAVQAQPAKRTRTQKNPQTPIGAVNNYIQNLPNAVQPPPTPTPTQTVQTLSTQPQITTPINAPIKTTKSAKTSKSTLPQTVQTQAVQAQPPLQAATKVAQSTQAPQVQVQALQAPEIKAAALTDETPIVAPKTAGKIEPAVQEQSPIVKGKKGEKRAALERLAEEAGLRPKKLTAPLNDAEREARIKELIEQEASSKELKGYTWLDDIEREFIRNNIALRAAPTSKENIKLKDKMSKADYTKALRNFHTGEDIWSGVRDDAWESLQDGDLDAVKAVLSAKTPKQAQEKLTEYYTARAREVDANNAKTKEKAPEAKKDAVDEELDRLDAEEGIITLNMGVNPFEMIDQVFDFAGRGVRKIANIGENTAAGKEGYITRGLSKLGNAVESASEKYGAVDVFTGRRVLGDEDYMKALKQLQAEKSASINQAEQLARVMRQIEQTSPDALENIHRALAGDKLLRALTAEEKQLVKSIRKLVDDLSDDLVKRDIITPETAAKWKGGYLHRTYIPKNPLVRVIRQVTRKSLDNIHQRGTTKQVSDAEYQRMLANGEIGDIRKGLWEGYQDASGRWHIRRDWTEAERTAMGEVRDAAFTVPETILHMNTLRAQDNLMRSLYNTIPTSSRALDGYTKLVGNENFNYGKLEGLYVPNAIANDLKGNFREILNDQNELVKGYKELLRTWKKFKTIYNPASHVNNSLGNISILYFEGYNNPFGMFIKGLSTLRRLGKAELLQAKDAALTITNAEKIELNKLLADDNIKIAMLAKKNGVFGTSKIRDILGDPTLNPQQKAKGVLAGAQRVGKAVDNALAHAYQTEDVAARLALFTDLLNNPKVKNPKTKQPFKLEEARDYVLDLFPDYSRPMSAAARGLRGTGIVPFISWFWHTAPALMRQLDPRALTPNGKSRAGRGLAVLGAFTALYASSGTNPFELPPTYRFGARLPIPGLNNTWLKVDRMLPQYSVTPLGLLNNGSEWLRTAGFPGTLGTLFTNYDLYRDDKKTYRKGIEKAYDLTKHGIQSLSPQITNNIYNFVEALMADAEKRRTKPYAAPRSVGQELLLMLGINTSNLDAALYQRIQEQQELKEQLKRLRGK